MSSRRLLTGILVMLFAAFMSLAATAQSDTGQGNTASSAQTGSNPNYGAKSNDSNNMSNATASSDHTFMKKAAEGGKAEVELGQLAAEKASSPEVKKFGQRMVDDHTKANQQLEQVANKEGVTLPTTLSAKDQALKDKLSNASGEQFDQLYMSNMVRDHRQDVREFQQEAKNGKDPEVKKFAQQTLPTLQDHLKQAESIAPKAKQQASNQ